MLRISLYILGLGIFFSSCEKVIDLNLDAAGKKFVIEATMDSRPGSATVLISTTKPFNDLSSFDGVSDATVTIAEEGQAPVILSETSTGIYRAMSISGTPGKLYNLVVKIGNEEFTASCRMPYPVTLDSIFVEEENIFGEKMNIVNVEYTDPLGKGNAYRFIQYVNGNKESTIFVRDDEFSDGNKISARLWYSLEEDEENRINSGDDVAIEMYCIDPAIYKYWNSLDRSATGQTQSASPANPVTNLRGGALGYFSVHYVSSKSIVAP